jgi:hypothetical protein
MIPRLPHLLVAAVGSLALLPLAAAPSHAQATRTYVSGVGDDVNPCSRTAPCKTFAGAISKTAAGGYINVLDSGGYGAVTITKPITIDGTGANASILNSSTNGVIINLNDATPGDVVLRNLDISGPTGEVCPATSGNVGVRVLKARSVTLDDISFTGQKTAIETPLTNASSDIYVDVSISNVHIAANCEFGINLNPAAGKQVRASISRSTITQSNTALRVGASAEAWVSDTRLNLNNTGVQLAGGVAHQGCGTEVAGNATDGAFSDYACGATILKPTPLPPAAPVPATSLTYCTVPRLTGKTKAQAVTLLKKAGCAAGKVTQRKGPKAKRKKVLLQTIPVGTQVRPGTKVGLTLGR